MEELKDIKMVELNIGRNVKSVKLTVFNKLQEEILNLFNIKNSDFDKAL